MAGKALAKRGKPVYRAGFMRGDSLGGTPVYQMEKYHGK
jgi:hypothetical protein